MFSAIEMGNFLQNVHIEACLGTHNIIIYIVD